MSTKLLRQKVLDLAIYGKLVPQNPEHEPAVVAFENFRQKSQIKYSSKTSDDIPFTIPSNWCWVRIGEITETTDYIANGSFADTRENVKFYKEENYALLVKTQDFNNNFTDDLTYTDKQGYDFLKKSQLFGGELLLSNIGASIGKALIVPSFNKPMAVAPNSIIVRPCSIYLTQLLKAVMLSSYGQNALIEFTGGSAMPKFNKTQLRSLYIPLPPLEEQKLIVEEIERIFALIDTVEQNKTDEPASKMLEKLRAEKEEKIAKGQLKRDKNDSYIYKSADGKWLERKADGSEEEIEVPFEIPESWSWCHGYEIMAPMTLKKTQGITFEYIDIESINNKKHIIASSKTPEVSKAPSRASRELKTGDTLFSLVRPYLENIAFVNTEYKDCIASTGFYVCRPRNYVYPQSLFYALTTKYCLYGLNAFMKGDNSPSISGENIQNWLFPLPPLNEQKLIVAKIEEIFTYLDSITK